MEAESWVGRQWSRHTLYVSENNSGRATVQYLADEGWEVINFDMRRPAGASEDGKTGTPAYRIMGIDLSKLMPIIRQLGSDFLE